jgi:hypothetical protein
MGSVADQTGQYRLAFLSGVVVNSIAVRPFFRGALTLPKVSASGDVRCRYRAIGGI